MHGNEGQSGNLDRTSLTILAASRRPRVVSLAAVGAACALAWIVLLAYARVEAGMALPVAYGPGTALLDLLPDVPVPDSMKAFFALCAGAVALDLGAGLQLAVLTGMWFLMAIAMMLPSAAPLIVTYGDIAETAAAKRERVVATPVLVLGYLAAWLAVSLVFALGTVVLARVGAGGTPAGLPPALAASALAVAGLYQFSSLRAACLKRCRNPFATLFARWSTRPAAIFRLGVEQGVWCVGCCWALMLVMFVVGVMNPFWMALLGMLALVEKTVASDTIGRLAGAILLVWAAALLVVSAQS